MWEDSSAVVAKVLLLYGLGGGLLIVALKLLEYRFLVVEHSLEIYGGAIALIFAAVGIRLGRTFARTKQVVVVREVAVPAAPFVQNDAKLAELGITPHAGRARRQAAWAHCLTAAPPPIR